MRYSFLLKTPDADCFMTGRIWTDPASSKLVGTIDLPDGTVEISDIVIVPGESLSFTKNSVRYSLKPDADAPSLSESMRQIYTWWAGDCFDGTRRGFATCVLGKGTNATPKSVSRCAVLDPYPHAVSMV